MPNMGVGALIGGFFPPGVKYPDKSINIWKFRPENVVPNPLAAVFGNT